MRRLHGEKHGNHQQKPDFEGSVTVQRLAEYLGRVGLAAHAEPNQNRILGPVRTAWPWPHRQYQAADLRRASVPAPRKPRAPKVSPKLREMVSEALDKAGGVDYLAGQAETNSTAFLGLLARTAPVEVSGPDGGPLQINVVDYSKVETP